MQQVQGVVVLHDGQRLQEQGGLGLGLVVDDAGDGAPVVGLDGDDVAAVALGDEGVLEGVLVFRPEKILFDLAVDPLPGVGQFPAHPGQPGAGLVQDEMCGLMHCWMASVRRGRSLRPPARADRLRGQIASRT